MQLAKANLCECCDVEGRKRKVGKTGNKGGGSYDHPGGSPMGSWWLANRLLAEYQASACNTFISAATSSTTSLATLADFVRIRPGTATYIGIAYP